jgi:hypothetical protein
LFAASNPAYNHGGWRSRAASTKTKKMPVGEDKMNDVAAGPAATPTTAQIYKVALASIIGSVIEQYDFLVTGVIAATVWGGIFFKLPGLAAVAAAIGVYGLGIIIRPVGAFIFGHIADRYGRKDAMV